MKFPLTILLFLLFCTNFSQAQIKADFRGQISALHVSGFSDPYSNLSSLRYIPELKLSGMKVGSMGFEAEFSANANSYLEFFSPDSLHGNVTVKPYRASISLTGDQSELRLGLQKINFGSATMLRPLMWFDKIDARDPLQLTDGVYAALFRYYFLNNANVWLWGLIGNERVKGWEQFSTADWQPEFGGRLQLPAGTGEIALTTHYRTIDPAKPAIQGLFQAQSLEAIPEFRLGLDGKWDLIAGLWFEASLERADYSKAFPELPMGLYSRKVTLGADYTFGLGSGLTTMAEQFYYGQADHPFESAEGINFSALSLHYPLTMFLSVSGMVYYDWTHTSWYRFVNFQIVLDKWSFFLMGFWNPDQFQIYQNLDEPNLFAGKGIQLMLVYNH